MALRINTVEYAFDTLLTNLATNTALGTSTRHDFAAVTARIPETTSRTFRSAYVEVGWRDVFTAATTVSSWRIGLKVGVGAFTDVDFTTSSITNAGDHESGIFVADVTSQLASQFTGSSQSIQVGFVVATSVASNINNVSAKLVVTYEYDDAGITETLRTLRVPIQSHSALPPTTLAELGVDGLNPTPRYQIPKLDDWLPVGATVRQAWLQFEGNSGTQGVADHAYAFQVDAVAENVRATFKNALDTAVWFRDIAIYDTSTFATSAPHLLNVRATVANYFPTIGAVLHVTYSYDPTTATSIVNSLVLALRRVNEGKLVTTFGAAAADVYETDVEITEPGTIALMQSGLVTHLSATTSGTVNVKVANQATRAYGLSWSSVASGGFPHVYRIDHGAGTTITKTGGVNGAWDAGAATVQTIAGDGYVQFQTGSPSVGEKILGLSVDNPDASFGAIDYAIWMTGAGAVNIIENGVTVATSVSTFVSGDEFRVNRTGTVVTYQKRTPSTGAWATMFTSAASSTGALLVDTSFFQTNTILHNIRLFSAGTEVVLSWTTIVAVTVTQHAPLQLARGKNKIVLTIYAAASMQVVLGGATVYLNYKSGVASGGQTHNRSTAWLVAVMGNSAGNLLDQTQLRTPSIPESTWRLTAHHYRNWHRTTSASTIQLAAEIVVGELNGDGWYSFSSNVLKAVTLGMWEIVEDLTEGWNRQPDQAGKMNLGTVRLWRRYAPSFAADTQVQWVTHRSVSYAITGQVSAYTGDGSGITVDVFNAADERVATATTAAGGTFAATVYDDTTQHYAVARQSSGRRGRSDDFTPGAGNPTITFADSNPPTITIVSPTPGSTIARGTPIVFDVTDETGQFRRILPAIKFSTGRYELIHDGDAFTPDYNQSTRATQAGGFRYTVTRGAGWEDTQFSLVSFVYDLGGNEPV